MSTPVIPAPAAPVPTYEDLARLLECALTRPGLSQQDVSEGCNRARKYGIAALVVRPSDVDQVARQVTGSSLRLASLVDVPHGYSTTAAKLYAARDLLRRGVREIETTLNTGKLLSREFHYLELELQQMVEACRESGASLAVNLETEYLNEELKILACRIARRAGAEFVATDHAEDVPLLLSHSREKLKIKSLAPVADLDAALALRAAGCSRVQLAEPWPILEAWKAKLAAEQATAPPSPAS